MVNKREFIKELALQAKSTQREAEDFLNAFEEVVTAKLKEGKKIQLVGFGSFEAAVRKGRMGRNPKTGEEIEIQDSIYPRFKAGRRIKDILNDK